VITVLVLNSFSNYLRDDVLNIEPIHGYILGDTIYTWSVENFQLVRKHVVEQDEERKASGIPYWLVFLCSRSKIDVSKLQARHFPKKVWANSTQEPDVMSYEYRMASLDFKLNIYSNSIKVAEDVEEIILARHVDHPIEVTVPGLFDDLNKPLMADVMDFKVDALQKGDSSKAGTMVYLQCSGALHYPLLLSNEVLPLITNIVTTINFKIDME